MAWSGAEVFVFDSGGGHAYAPALGTWRAAAGPALTIGPGVFRSATLTGNRLVARVADPAVVVDAYDRAADRWLPSGPPPGLPSSVDGAFVSTGSSVITWGIPQNSSELQLGTPNAAWIWSPP